MTKPRWVIELLFPLQSFPHYFLAERFFFLFESRTFFFLKAEHFRETASKEIRAAGFPGVA